MTDWENKLIPVSQKRKGKPQQLLDTYQAMSVSQLPNATTVDAQLKGYTPRDVFLNTDTSFQPKESHFYCHIKAHA